MNWRTFPRAAAAGALLALCIASPALAAHTATTASKPAALRGAAVAAPAPTPALLQKAQDVAIFALSLIGVDYRFGGDSPQHGVDCSGLVRYVFSQTTGIALPRTSAALGKTGLNVARIDLVPGDLVFFNTRHFINSHVGIYLGDDRFVHAPSQGGEVRIASMADAYWRTRFNGARRLIGALPGPAVSSASATGSADRVDAASANALGMALTRVELTQ